MDRENCSLGELIPKNGLGGAPAISWILQSKIKYLQHSSFTIHFSVSSVGTLHIEPSSGNCFTYLSLDLVPIPQETLQGDHVIQSDIMQVEPSKIQRTISIANISRIADKSIAAHLCAVSHLCCLSHSLLYCLLYSFPLYFCVLHALTQMNCRIDQRQLQFVFFSNYSSVCHNPSHTATNSFKNFKAKVDTTRCSSLPPCPLDYLHHCSLDPCMAENPGYLGRAH